MLHTSRHDAWIYSWPNNMQIKLKIARSYPSISLYNWKFYLNAIALII